MLYIKSAHTVIRQLYTNSGVCGVCFIDLCSMSMRYQVSGSIELTARVVAFKYQIMKKYHCLIML